MKKASIIIALVLAVVLLASCTTSKNAATNTGLLGRLDESTKYIRSQIGDMDIQVGLILGSGLGDLAKEIEDPVFIRYENIPNFPVSTVAGHEGRLVIGKLEGKTVICMQGRFHYYEGYEMNQVAFPIQVMKKLGVDKVIITNAAGCVNINWEAGDLMLITDHIKFAPESPLRGHNEDELGERFFPMSTVYDAELADIARVQAKSLGIDLKEGVYMFFSGPNYETPAEIRAARVLGADAVGMSTVPEVIAASHCGLKVLGISCMTNMAAGILDQPLTHAEVLETSLRVRDKFTSLVKAVLKNM